jgi:septal ring factor EnvC (AmiA/AmiB activator)
MKRKVFILGLAAATLLPFTGCNNIEEERMRSQKTIDSLQSIVDSKNNELDVFFETLNEIEDNLLNVSAKFGSVEELRRNKPEMRNDVKVQINDQINDIANMLNENKQKLAVLNKKLAEAKGETASLKEYVEKLNARIAEQEEQILNLVTDLEQKKMIIETLNTNVADLTKSNTEKEQIIAKQIADFDRTQGLTVMENILQSKTDIDAVFAQNDEMALGAQKALADMGMNDVLIVGFDATDDAVDAVDKGTMSATVAQQPLLIGQTAINAIDKILKGEKVDSFIPVELKLVTKN